MAARRFLEHLIDGYRTFVNYADVDGYRELDFRQRKLLDLQVVLRGTWTGGFWKAALIVLALMLATEILCMHLDLRDWRADLLRCGPFLLIAPWIARARRRQLRLLLRRSAKRENR